MGRGADTYRAHGRGGRARRGGTLALQRRESRLHRHGRMAEGHTTDAGGDRQRAGGHGPVPHGPAGRGGVRLHPTRRPDEVSARSHRARHGLSHTLTRGKPVHRGTHTLGRGTLAGRQRTAGDLPPGAAQRRYRGDHHLNHTAAQAGVALDSEDVEGKIEDKAGTEGDAAEGGTAGEGDAGAQVPQQED